MSSFRGERQALEQEYCTGLTFGLIPSWGTRPNEFCYTFELVGEKAAHCYYIDGKSYNHVILFPLFLINLITLDESRVYRKALHNYLTHKVQPFDTNEGALSSDLEHTLVRRGFLWYRQGNYDRAIDTYTEVLKSNPTNMYALAGRGDAWAEKKEYVKALADYDQGLLVYPTTAQLYYRRGYCWQEYAKQGEWYRSDRLTNALADYSKAIDLAPDQINSYVNRAFINSMSGRYKQALDDYDKILKLDPENKKAQKARANTLKDIQEQKEPLRRQ